MTLADAYAIWKSKDYPVSVFHSGKLRRVWGLLPAKALYGSGGFYAVLGGLDAYVYLDADMEVESAKEAKLAVESEGL